MKTFLVAKNNASSKLAADITSDALSLMVLTGTGVRYPSEFPYHITIGDEIIEVTARSTDTLTVTRAQEGTSAATHKKGAPVRLNITAQVISEMQDAINDIDNEVEVLLLAPPTHGDSHEHEGTDEISVAGLSGELADAQTPKAHKTSHQSVGSDAIKIDDLAAPDDNTDLNASTEKHGLCPKAPNDTSKFLRGDMTWNAPISIGAMLTFDGSTKVVTSDTTTWTDLDLSAYVGANRAIVCLRIDKIGGATYTWAFRRNGDTDEHYDTATYAMNVPRLAASDSCYVIVHTDANGVIEIKNESSSGDSDIYLEWYLK